MTEGGIDRNGINTIRLYQNKNISLPFLGGKGAYLVFDMIKVDTQFFKQGSFARKPGGAKRTPKAM
jgi:hypothetical protein